MERKKVCSLMDCQKLSRQACAHAAHNDRLPVQTVVQVLYYEQQRLRDVVNDGVTRVELPPVLDELSILRRENEELKVEVVKIKMKLREFEKPSISSSQTNTQLQAAAENPPPPKKSFINSVSKRLGRLYQFVRADGVASNSKGRVRRAKDRRHSVS